MPLSQTKAYQYPMGISFEKVGLHHMVAQAILRIMDNDEEGKVLQSELVCLGQSLAAEEEGNRASQMQIAATHASGNFFEYPTNFHPPISTHGTYRTILKGLLLGHPEAGRDEAEELSV